ncbi:MAG: FecR domain-containing protein [Cytophagales bacterium]|nr:FecR domain-containing protein [Cytophagales bacterium]
MNLELEPDIEDILFKQCTNEEISSSESAKLEAWLNANPKNRKTFSQLKLSFVNPESEERSKIRHDVWDDLLNRINTGETSIIQATKHNRYWLRAAVIFLICTVIGVLIYQVNFRNGIEQTEIKEVRMIEKVCLPGQKFTTTLPDGTTVKLNSDSKIIVPESFTNEKREVALYGEAFFDVAKDASKPFLVRTKDIQVQVLGTSFNVKSYPNEQSVVAVATGKVAVSDGINLQDLAPGEKISYRSDDSSMIKESFNWEEEYGWKDNILVIRGENFAQISDKLSKWYGVEFIIKDSTNNFNKKFSGRYLDSSLSNVLDGLSYLYDFKYQINNKTVTLSSNKK